MQIVKKIFIITLILIFFLTNNITLSSSYASSYKNHTKSCLSPGSPFDDDGDGGSRDFDDTCERAIDLLTRHKDFQAFIKAGIPGHAGRNPISRILPQATEYGVEIKIDEHIVMPPELETIIRTEFTGIDAVRVIKNINSVFKYRLSLSPNPQRTLQAIRDNLTAKSKEGISLLFINKSRSLFGDFYQNGLAWTNLPALKHLIAQIDDAEKKTLFLGLILGIGLSHEILGHESGFHDEDELTKQDVDIALSFIYQAAVLGADINPDNFLHYLETTLTNRSSFIRNLKDTDLFSQIGLSKIVTYMDSGNRADLDSMLIPFEISTGSSGRIEELGITVGLQYPEGTEVRIAPKKNSNYGWYLEIYIWDEEKGSWSGDPAGIFIFMPEGERLQLKRITDFGIVRREWVDYIKEEILGIAGGIVKPGPLVITSTDTRGRLGISEPEIVFMVKSLANKEALVMLARHPAYGDKGLIYVYSKNKYEWEQKEIEKGVRQELSPPEACYVKTGKGQYERIEGRLSFAQALWLKWFEAEPGQEGFRPPDYTDVGNNRGEIAVVSKSVTFRASMLKGKKGLVKFVKDSRYKRLHPAGGDEFIFVYDKEKYDRESFEVQMGIREQYSPPEKAFVKTSAGTIAQVADHLTINQLLWLDWMYTETDTDILEPDIFLAHVTDAGRLNLANLEGRTIQFNVGTLAGKDAVVKLAIDPNFGRAIYIYEAAEYFRQEQEIRAGARSNYSLPTAGYRKTGVGAYKKIPERDDSRRQVDFNRYVWIEWANQKLGEETVRPAGEFLTECSDDEHARVRIGIDEGRLLEFYVPELRGQDVIVLLEEHPYYGELIYIYDAATYNREKMELVKGKRDTLSPPAGCYKKVAQGRCRSFPQGISINQLSWFDWWAEKPVKPIGDLEETSGKSGLVSLVTYNKKRIWVHVDGLEEGEKIIVRFVEDPDYGDLVYIYQKETLESNPHAFPIQVYRKTSRFKLRPLPGKSWDSLQRLTWLDYLYRKDNIHGEIVKPRGYSLQGKIDETGDFSFSAKGMRFRFRLPDYKAKDIRIVKNRHNKYEYIFKIFLEGPTLREPIAVFVRHPDENKLIKIEDHPDYALGDEAQERAEMGIIARGLSKEELLARFISKIKWIDYWGLRDEFISLLRREGVTGEFYNRARNERVSLFKDMGIYFARLMYDGMSTENALKRVIHEFIEQNNVFDICDDFFTTKEGQRSLGHTVRLLHITESGLTDKRVMGNIIARYCKQNSYLESCQNMDPSETTDIQEILDYVRENRTNLVVIDLNDPVSRAAKIQLIRQIYDYLPIHAYVVVVQRTDEDGYQKTVEGIMEEEGFQMDVSYAYENIPYIAIGYKKQERVTEDEIASDLSQHLRTNLKEKAVYQREDIIKEVETVLYTTQLSPAGMRRFAEELVESNDSEAISRLLEYLDYNGVPYKVDRNRHPHAPRVIAPGVIEFNFYARPDTEILLAGDFTNWDQSPIKLEPKGPVREDGLQRYSWKSEDLYGVHFFKFIVDGEWHQDLDSVSPYKENSSYHDYAINNSSVWSQRPAADPFITSLARSLIHKLGDEATPEEVRRRIAIMLPLNLVPSHQLRRADIAKRIIKYRLQNTEGISLGVLAAQLELILKYFNLSPEDMFNLGKEIIEETADAGMLFFLLDYLRYNTSPYDVPHDRYYQAPVIHGLGKIEFVYYAPEGSQVELIGDFTSWQYNPITMTPNPGERRHGLVKYSVIVDDLYGPHLFKFRKRNPSEHEFHWCGDIDTVTPYKKIERYGTMNSVLWTGRTKDDIFIKGLVAGFSERITSSDVQTVEQRYLLAENFPLENYPELRGDIQEARERTKTELWRERRPGRAPPAIDTLQRQPVLYILPRNFADPDRGLNGIDGFIEWYRNNIAPLQANDSKLFPTVMFAPPFEIGEDNKIGSWGSPWATKSFDRIDPKIGTKEELIEGIRQLQNEFGVKVVFDIGLHSAANDSDILQENPGWGLPRTGAWQTDWKDITPLDLRKVRLRRYMLGKLIDIKETYGIDGFRIDGVSQTSVFHLTAYEYWTSELQKRYPGMLLLIAEGRDPFLLNTAQVIYNWDIAFTLRNYLDKHKALKKPQRADALEESRMVFYKAILRREAPENHDEYRGLLLSFSRTQDSAFELGRPNTVKAIMFAIPRAIPAFWMPQICKGYNIDRKEFKDRDWQIKFSPYHVTGVKEDIEFEMGLLTAKTTHPALLYGDLQVIEPPYCSHPEEVIVFQRNFGPHGVTIVSGVSGNLYKIDLPIPFIDVTNDPDDQEYWIGDIITGKGIRITKAQMEDFAAGRRLARVIISGDHPVYLSAEKWDPDRHSLSQKTDPARVQFGRYIRTPDILPDSLQDNLPEIVFDEAIPPVFLSTSPKELDAIAKVIEPAGDIIVTTRNSSKGTIQKGQIFFDNMKLLPKAQYSIKIDAYDPEHNNITDTQESTVLGVDLMINGLDLGKFLPLQAKLCKIKLISETEGTGPLKETDETPEGREPREADDTLPEPVIEFLRELTDLWIGFLLNPKINGGVAQSDLEPQPLVPSSVLEEIRRIVIQDINRFSTRNDYPILTRVRDRLDEITFKNLHDLLDFHLWYVSELGEYGVKISATEIPAVDMLKEKIRSNFKTATDRCHSFFSKDSQKEKALWYKLLPNVAASVANGGVKVIDAATLIHYDEDTGHVYPRSLDFKLGIAKLKEMVVSGKLSGLKIIIVNIDKRYTSSEVMEALDLDEQDEIVSALDINGSRSFRDNILTNINKHLGSSYNASDLTIAYLKENRTMFTKIKDARLIEIAESDNWATFISGLGVLLSVLIEDKNFLDELPAEIREELRSVLIGEKDAAEIFRVNTQPMSEEYYMMLQEEQERIKQSA